MLALQHRQKALCIESFGIVEVQSHAFRERFVALGNRVVQVTHWNQLTEPQVISAVHQQLQHQLECGAFSLQRSGNCNQRLDQCRAEWVHLAEHVPVSRRREQGVENFLAHPKNVIKSGLQRLPRSLVDGA